MDNARRASRRPRPGYREGAGSPRLEPEHEAVDLELVRLLALLPREVREGIGRRAVQHGAVDVESRAVAGAVEGLGVLVEADRTAQVGAVLREHLHVPALLDDVTAERELARLVGTASIGQDEA